MFPLFRDWISKWRMIRYLQMREKPSEDYIYHVYNRGVDKRIIFDDDNDRQRFVSGLYFFNNKNSTDNLRFFDIQSRNDDTREKIVEILSFVLMPNHFHLLIKPLVENGLSEFMQKLGIGYTNYFNIKNERTGSLFQGKYKFVRIEGDEQLAYIPYYIHFNPVELVESKWKEQEVVDKDRAINFLKSYPWSSLRGYLGNNCFSQIINKEILKDYLGEPEDLEKEISDWLKETGYPNHTNLWME